MERTETMTAASAPNEQNDRSYIDWAAIFGGAVVATAVATLFTAFGAALGLSAISAEPGEGSFNFALILTGLWMVVTLVASYATGGYIAGRMRRRVDSATPEEVSARDGINGLVVWGVGMLVGAVLLTNAVSSTVSAAGSVAGAAAGTVADAAIAAGGAMIPAMDGNPLDFVGSTMLRPNAVDPLTATPDQMAAETAAILGNVLATGEISDADRSFLQSATAASTGLPPAEAAARVDTAVIAAQTARDDAAAMAAEAEQLAIDVAETARKTAILTAFLLAAASLVAAATSCVAAVRGGVHRDEGRIFRGFAVRV